MSNSNWHLVKHYDVDDEPETFSEKTRPRVLIVGDDPEAALIGRWLAEPGLGYEVRRGGDFAGFQQSPSFDLAVLTRPTLSVARLFVANSPGAALLLVADLDVHGEHLEPFFRLGVPVDHVRLPVDEHDVVGRVQALLRRQARRPTVRGSAQAIGPSGSGSGHGSAA